MKHGLKILIASILVGSALLTACGKGGGGGSSASTPVSWANTPAGYIGNGSWSGKITVSSGYLPTYYQLAALTGLCYAQGCQQSFIDVQVTLQSSGGYGYGGSYGYPGYPTPTTGTTVPAVQTQGAFRLSGSNGSFTRNPVYTTGGSASFTMAAGLYSQNGYPQAPASGEPYVRLVGKFTDQTQSVMNVTLYYNGSVVGTGQLFNTNSYGGGYGYGGGYYGGAGYYGGGYGYGGGYVGGGYYYYPYSVRK